MPSLRVSLRVGDAVKCCLLELFSRFSCTKRARGKGGVLCNCGLVDSSMSTRVPVPVRWDVSDRW